MRVFVICPPGAAYIDGQVLEEWFGFDIEDLCSCRPKFLWVRIIRI